ncbi:MAG: pitrilysin family protein [Chitinophagaceae bacterium]
MPTQPLNRTLAPLIKDAVEFDLKLQPIQRFTLDNGVEVFAIDAGTEEVLQLEWIFSAGNWHEKKNLVAAVTNHLLKNGTVKRTAYTLNEHFEYFGSYLNRACYSEHATITLHCLNKHLNELLPVVREIMTESIFPEDELQLFKTISKQKLEVNLKKCEFIANRLIDSYVYGPEHPYGKYSSFEAYDALQREELLEYYQQQYVNGHCRIFVAGKLPADIMSLLNMTFGSMPLRKNVENVNQYTIAAADQKKYRVANDPDGVQGAIRLAAHAPGRSDPDYPKLQVLNNIYGGYFGSRLMSNIREDKGYTYGIHSFLENHMHQSAWVVSTEAGRDVAEAAVTEIYNEMEDLREELVEDDELMLVKNHMMGTLLSELDGPFHIMSKWKNLILNNLDESYFYKTIETIKTITAEELQALSVKYLDPKKFYELIVV